MSAGRTRRGFSLLEILCVLILMAVVGLALTMLLRETLQAERLQAEGLERLLQTRTLADLFRSDVARADQAPEKLLGYQAGASTLILFINDSEQIVYLWQGGKLLRRVLGKKEPEQTLLVGDKLRVEFGRDAGNTRLLRARVLALRGKNASPVDTLEIAAALGGDRR
jgi:prepilin-type N-terminal cleavage/methylation domain-containing protein